MTDDSEQTDTNAAAWRDRAAYHEDRAAQERVLAVSARSDAAYIAHRVLGERHLQLAATAGLVAGMPDAEPSQSSSLEQTGELIRKSYGDVE
ncbi:hypothetical protein [Sphingomonas faeni]|uniref:hypothetical protein n=1 Tax=Sphingomonas faeni TaxID=185950 RepID=UPI002780586A|nr:hypothetical protein [Sphingomonas faeni]MDQ0837822.1 hypothetical protein [Sphingomonas faeni]